MTATVVRVFTGATNPATIDQSATFTNADFLFFQATGVPSGDEYEVAGSLLIDIVGTEEIGGVPIATFYGVKELPLAVPLFDTAVCVPIPTEFSQSSLNMRVTLATTYSFTLDVYAVSSGVTLQAIAQQIAELKALVEASDTGNIADLIDQITAILPAVLSVPTAGGNLELLVNGVAILL